MADIRNLLILERSSSALSFEKKSDGQYVLEGVFGQIGVRNRNNRIYDEGEYLPQIKLLQEKIKSSKLLGELDHPKTFDTSLSKASHVIEKLEYDPESKQVRGRIRLLNTNAGKEAQALVDDGIPIHISSRAAGVVESDGHVKIKRLFTYDLVAEPGFENAELKRVNESFGLSDDDDIQIFELDQPIPNDKYSNNENNSENMGDHVKLEDYNKYSKYIASQIEEIKSEISSIKEGANDSKVIKYSEHVAERVNDLYKYMLYMAEQLDKSISHTDHIVENVRNLQGYVEHVAEQADYGIQYTEEVAKKSNTIVEYNNYIGEKLNTIAKFADYLAENVGKGIKYSEYLKDNIETVGNYSDYLGENVNKIHKRVFNISEDEDSIKTSSKSLKEREKENKTEEVVNTNESVNYKKEVSEKLNKIIESAQKQIADNDGDLHFLRFLDADKRNEFKSLNDKTKKSLVEACKDKKYCSTAEVEAIWESVVNPVERKLEFIEKMPDEFVEKWAKLPDSRKNQIIAEGKFYPLKTQYQIDTFWKTRDLRSTVVESEKIVENKTAGESSKDGKYANKTVDDPYINNFREELHRRFRNVTK